MPISALQKPRTPLYQINNIERYEQQFPLLRRMDALMVYDILVNPKSVPRPKRAEQIDTYPFRNQSALNYHI